MRRFALFAVFPFLAAMAICQSPATPPGTPAAALPSFAQPLFGFNTGQLGQMKSATPARTASCNNRKPAQNQPDGQFEMSQVLHVPCVNLDTLAQVAQSNQPASPLLNQQWPLAKFMPIPTQWPDAKVEPIPTRWPDLKIQQITADNPGKTHAK